MNEQNVITRTRMKIGDVVSLNSDSNHQMTVYSIQEIPEPEQTLIKCAWFDSDLHIRYEDFDVRVLSKLE